MNVGALIRPLELLGWVAVIGGLLVALSFVIWTVITAVLWIVAHRRGDDVPQPLAADGWFDTLEREA